MFVVVGGGIAAVSCAEELGRLRPDASILLLSASQALKGVSPAVPHCVCVCVCVCVLLPASPSPPPPPAPSCLALFVTDPPLLEAV